MTHVGLFQYLLHPLLLHRPLQTLVEETEGAMGISKFILISSSLASSWKSYRSQRCPLLNNGFVLFSDLMEYVGCQGLI
jgi:hypothetical protein